MSFGFDLVGMDLQARRKETLFTVLKKPEGSWQPHEVGRLIHGLTTEAQRLPAKPEFIILWDKHEEAKVRQVLPGEYEHKILIGYDNPELPWRPMF